MRSKIPWTPTRIICLVLGFLFLPVFLLGVDWVIGGLHTAHEVPTNGEDPSKLFGYGFVFAGGGLIFIGGILSLLFFGIYRNTTRRLKLKP